MNRILRNEGEETVDEVVVENCTVHIEQMDVGSYWIGITDASGNDVAVNLTTKRCRTTPIRATVEEDPGWRWDTDETHAEPAS